MVKPTRPHVPMDLGALAPGRGLFRLHGARRREPAVDTWLSEDIKPRVLARPWFEHMRLCGEDVRELVHDGGPAACVGDAPFAYVNAFKAHVDVGFFQGASLPDPAGLLAGTGKRMRHVALRTDRPVDAGALQHLIRAAYADIRDRLHGALAVSRSRPDRAVAGMSVANEQSPLAQFLRGVVNHSGRSKFVAQLGQLLAVGWVLDAALATAPSRAPQRGHRMKRIPTTMAVAATDGRVTSAMTQTHRGQR